ncbi:hypothetical protein ACOME3_003464 [Neoechinorhynchus agilis]
MAFSHLLKRESCIRRLSARTTSIPLKMESVSSLDQSKGRCSLAQDNHLSVFLASLKLHRLSESDLFLDNRRLAPKQQLNDGSSNKKKPAFGPIRSSSTQELGSLNALYEFRRSVFSHPGRCDVKSLE